MISPWLSVLTSSPGITISFRCAGDLDGLDGAGEHVVVGDGDRPEPFRLRVLDERLRLDRAVVRMVRVHVEIDDDPVAVAEGIAVAGAADARPAAAGRRSARRRPRAASPSTVEVALDCASRGPSRPSRHGEPRPRRAAPPTRLRARAARRAPRDRRSHSRSTRPRAAAGRCRRERARRWPPRRASTAAPPASRAISFVPGRVPRRGSSGVASAVPSARARPPSPGSVGSRRSTARATAL